MKLLIIAERYWPEVGAAPSRLANMAEGLKQEGAEVDVLTGLPNYPQGKIFKGYNGRLTMKEDVRGIKVFRYWIYATVSRTPIARILNMFSLACTLWLFAFRWKRILSYDVVIIQTPTLVVASSALILFKKLYRRKCILNVSDIWPITAFDMGALAKESRSYRFLAILEQFLYKNADGFLGQSEEILNHIAQEIDEKDRHNDNSQKDTDDILGSKMWTENNRLFLYRNLQIYENAEAHQKEPHTLKLVFSGMLGVAQDVLGIVQNVNFKELGVEFHIIGGGKQYDEIEKWCKAHPESNVYTYGFVPKTEISLKLKKMDASIVPLVTRIRGAVPSKIYDILPQGLPIIFCGGGEAANFIQRNHVGFSCPPSDYETLTQCITQLRDMSAEHYEALSEKCICISKEQLDFKRQMHECHDFLSEIMKPHP